MAAPLTVEQALARIVEDVAPKQPESVAIEAAHRPHPCRSATRAPDAAAVRCLRHGRLCRARRRCREPAGHACRDRPGRRRPPLPRHHRRGPGRPHLHRRPVRRSAPTPSSSRRTRGRDGDSVTVRDGSIDVGHIRTSAASTSARASVLLGPGRRLGPARAISLAAAMGHGHVPVRRPPAHRRAHDRRRARGSRREARSRPDHLLQPPGRRRAWPRPPAPSTELLGIARDTRESLDAHFAKAHERRRHRHHRRRLGRRPRPRRPRAQVAGHGRSPSGASPMRPGKPLMFGRLGRFARAGPARQPGLRARVHARVPAAADPGPARASRPKMRGCPSGPRRGRHRGQRPAPALHARDLHDRAATASPWSRPCAPRTAPCWPRWRKPTACWSAPAQAPAAPAGSLWQSCPSIL